MADFQGLFVASLTPVRTDFSIDVEALSLHCKELIASGCQGVVLFGSTGEGPSFSNEERMQAVKEAIGAGVSPKKIIVGIQCTAIDDAVNVASEATNLSCLALLVAPPFYYKGVSDAGILHFYQQFIYRAAHPELKILLYHIPKHTGVSFTVSLVRALHEQFPKVVVGFKDSDGNMDFVRELVLALPNFSLFMGTERHIYEATKLGAKGAISGLANAYPELVLSLMNSTKGLDRLAAVQTIIRRYPVIAAIKSLVEKHKGAAWSVLRPPFVALSPEEKAALYSQLC